MHILLVAFLLIGAMGLPANAAQITINCPDQQHREVRLRAQRVEGAPATIERSVDVPGVVNLSLPPGMWEVSVDGSDVWSSPAYGREGDAMVLQVWRTVPLSGKLNRTIKGLKLQFTGLDGAPSGVVDCVVEDVAWRCAIPPGRYDLRFASFGFAPEYRFAAAAPSHDLALRFVAGASLSGRVERTRAAPGTIEGLDVTLSGAAKETVRTNAKGFFQFKGLSAGEYTVRATKSGLASQAQTVRMIANTSAELNAPLLLDRPKRLLLYLAPILDPHGAPWRIRLFARNERMNHLTLVTESAASAFGDWSQEGLIAGAYDVEIATSLGERWKDADVTIANEDVTLPVDTSATKVSGTVTLGERPLQGVLSFGDEWGVKLHSDADGRFEGHVNITSQNVLVESESPHVKRTVKMKSKRNDAGDVTLEIHLPSTTLAGTVVNTEGAPQRGAIITLRGEQDLEQWFADADGGFQIAGFEPGPVDVTATSARHSSHSIKTELRLDEVAEVKLVLDPSVVVQGRVTTGDAPVVAMQISALPRDLAVYPPLLPQAMTNESGFFELELPPGTKSFDGLAIHPAFDIVIGRSTIQPEKQMHIRTEQIGGTIVVEKAPAGERILLRHNGAQIDARWIAQQAGGASSDESFTIPRLQPGSYSVCASKCVDIYLAPFATMHASFD